MIGCRRPALAAAAVMAIGASGCSERSAHDPFALMEGQGIYNAECAACHGARLEGPGNGPASPPDGKRPAPPLDASGLAWRQPRSALAAVVKFGTLPPSAPPGAVSDPHAFAGKLTDAQIDNVLAWIESQWPQDLLKQRAEILKPR
jgi:mono/diheme cytochrome c family protein